MLHEDTRISQLAFAFGALLHAWGLAAVGLCMIIFFLAFLHAGKLFMLRPDCFLGAVACSKAVVTFTLTEHVACHLVPYS